MKPGLAVLPLEVWADILIFPWITREQLARIVHKFKNRNFAEKLQFRLHDMGKHTLRYLTIEEVKENIFSRASLIVFSQVYQGSGMRVWGSPAVRCHLPRTQMPENIRSFKRLTIRYLDDQVLDFLRKIKSLLTNVVLDINAIESAPHIHIFLGHLLPLIGSIRRINCENYCLDFMERQFPGTLALAKELHLPYANPTFIPAYMNWLNAPRQFGQLEPRFLKISANFATITAIVVAVREQFLAATSPSTFIVFLDFYRCANRHIEELKLENAATKEELIVRNAIFEIKWRFVFETDHFYVEILRHPKGAGAKMQQWIKERAHYEKMFAGSNYKLIDEAEQQMISLAGPALTIGHITNNENNNAGAVDQSENKPAGCDEDQAGPSTSAKKTEK